MVVTILKKGLICSCRLSPRLKLEHCQGKSGGWHLGWRHWVHALEDFKCSDSPQSIGLLELMHFFFSRRDNPCYPADYEEPYLKRETFSRLPILLTASRSISSEESTKANCRHYSSCFGGKDIFHEKNWMI